MRPIAMSAQRVLVGLLAIALLVVGLLGVAVVAAPPAAADPAPIEQRPTSTVTADALPTVQINGVAWDQVIVGNTVYVGGEFSNARPAGAAPGTSLIPRSNLLAYDIRTGVLINSFAPVLNGPVKGLAASPDGSRVYVAGQFTTVNGVNRYRIAAFDTATGALVSNFAPAPNSTVNSVTVTDSAVYVGGVFTKVGSVDRLRLAAFSPTTGALLGWAPAADQRVNAILATPDRSRVIAAGAFATVNGSTATGLASVDANTGALLPWAANNVVRNYGNTAAMLSLSTDGSTIYSTGYWYGGTGNFEGVLAAEPNSGDVKWLADCHGDTYDASPANGVVYAVSHWHHCQNIGGFPDTSPRNTWHRANAMTADARGTVAHNNQGGYYDFFGYGAPAIVNWLPTVPAGSFTGQNQGGWTTEATNQYVVQGGEFPSVNGKPQQGLVRFAVPSLAPKKEGPRVSGTPFNPSVVAIRDNAVKVTWTANWDRDDQELTYEVLRSGTAEPVYTTTATSQYWNRPSLSWTDTDASPGQTYRYRISASDADGNAVLSDNVSVTVPTQVSPYLTQVIEDGAAHYWRMNGTSNQVDYAGASDLTGDAGVTAGGVGAIQGDSDPAAAFSGTNTGVADTSTQVTGPATFAAEAWVKTTTTSGGKIVGFGNSNGGLSSSYDRHVYMTNAGQIVFGVYPGGIRTVRSSQGYNDGQWHHIVAQLSGAGMALFIDGLAVASDPAITSAQAYGGYWRVGGDNLNGWPDRPGSVFLKGTIDEVAIYPAALSGAQIENHYTKSGRTVAGAPNAAPTAAFTSACADATCTFDSAGSGDPDGTIAAYAWDFGDGATSAEASPGHTYAASGTYTVELTVTDNRGKTDVVRHDVTVTKPAANQPPVAAFTVQCAERACSFDSSGSGDPDGTITSYAWDFGDGSPAGSGVSPEHTYDDPGDYQVTLTVTDNDGANDTASRTVTATAGANQAPRAAFTSSVSGLTASFDGSGSNDPDGQVVSYAWTFGDGSTGTGATVSKTYAGTGEYSVKLTVTDNAGETTSITKSVVVAPGAVIADQFDRTVSRWGTADTGGTWTYSGSTFDTNGRTGSIKLAGAASKATASLPASQRDVDVVADVAVDKTATGGGMYTTFITRQSGSSDYRFTLRHVPGGSVRLKIGRRVNGTETNLRDVAISGVSYAPGEVLRVRFTATGTGTTSLTAKVWRAGTAEPATAQITASDTTEALQSAGTFGIFGYLSGSATNGPVTIDVDNLFVTPGD